MNNISIRVEANDFSVDEAYQFLHNENHSDGAVVLFIGQMRDFNQSAEVSKLTLEHYPSMTQQALKQLTELAKKRWSLGRICIWHRIGEFTPGDRIVLVAVSAPHRAAAFAAAEYLMDTLKTTAPFWKKEQRHSGESRWVEAEDKDQLAAQRWQTSTSSEHE